MDTTSLSTIPPKTLENLWDQDLLLLDTRAESSYSQAHVAESVHVKVSYLKWKREKCCLKKLENELNPEDRERFTKREGVIAVVYGEEETDAYSSSSVLCNLYKKLKEESKAKAVYWLKEGFPCIRQLFPERCIGLQLLRNPFTMGLPSGFTLQSICSSFSAHRTIDSSKSTDDNSTESSVSAGDSAMHLEDNSFGLSAYFSFDNEPLTPQFGFIEGLNGSQSSFGSFSFAFSSSCFTHVENNNLNDCFGGPHPIAGSVISIPTDIDGSLYIGDDECARNAELLKTMGIKYILNTATECENHHMNDDYFVYKKLELTDSTHQKICCQDILKQSFDFINQALNSGSKVLVHCRGGRSRSVTIVLAYLMYYKNMALMDAYELVQQKRSEISPNLGFMGQLTNYERQLKSMKPMYFFSVEVS